MRARSIVLRLLLSTVTCVACVACGHVPRQPRVAQRGAPEYPVFKSASADDALPGEAPPKPDVELNRELEQPEQVDAESASCGFRAGDSTEYAGMFFLKGRPFARGDAFGKVTYGTFAAEEDRLYAPFSFYTDAAYVYGEIYLPDMPLFAAGPIVHDDWIHILRTRIATKSSVKGAFFAPDLKLPASVRLKTPLREDAYRIPCGMVTPDRPGTMDSFSGTSMKLEAPDAIVGLSHSPQGPAVAEIVHPSELSLEMLSMYKTTALVSVHVSTPESEVALVGWIHEGTMDNSGAFGIGEGKIGTIGHIPRPVHVSCDGVSVLASVDGKLYMVAEISAPYDFYGARAANGDLRIDLGADPAWSPDHGPRNGAKQPLDPFIPKEYLVRCTERKSE